MYYYLSIFLLLIASLSGCSSGNYKTPGVSKAPSELSADTLCFDYATSKKPELAAEIEARNLDCAGLLRDDPLYGGGPDDSVYRIH